MNQMASRQSSACFFWSLMIEYYCYGNGPSPSGKAQDFDSCTRGFESRWPSEKRLNFYHRNSAFFIFVEFIFYFLNHFPQRILTYFYSQCNMFPVLFQIQPFAKYKKAPGTASQGNTGGYRDSNPGPPEPQSGALTNCAIPTIRLQQVSSSYYIGNVLEGIRTPDPRLRRPLLYPAELRTHSKSARQILSGWWESNPRI